MELHIQNNVLLGLKKDIPGPESCSLVVPDTVTEIAPRAFYGCSWLEKVVIPGSVKTIGENAFAHCGNLKRITLPDSLTSIGARAFYAANLEGLHLPAEIREIGDEAFYGAFAWDQEPLYETVTDWDDETQLIPYIEDIVFPEGLKKIGASAFAGLPCRKVVLPEGLEELGEWAFHESDMQELVIPGSLKVIANSAFRECGQLLAVQINTGVERICKNAFFQCEKLRILNIQPGLKTIEGNAFFRCTALEELILPEGLVELEDMAFRDCGCLERVVFPGTLKCIGSDPHIPDIWPAEVTGEDEDQNKGVFDLCGNLSEVVIPEGVEKIGYEAFWNTGLRMSAFELPSTIKKIHGRCGLFWGREEWDKGLIWGEDYFAG